MTKTGTMIDYKRLSWQGTKVRGDDVLKAREAVRSRPHGVIPQCEAPHVTPGLLDQMGIKEREQSHVERMAEINALLGKKETV